MTRKYDAPRRLEQATATRAAIIAAAARLFAERGYGATTVAAVAAEARVSAKSVYALGDKARLLTLAVDQAIAGDDRPGPLADRTELQEVLQAGSVREQARRGGAFGARLLLRLYPIYRAFEQAAAVDPQVAELWRSYQQRRRDDVRRVIETVEKSASLRPGLDIERATDTIWALLGWHPVALLVEERGWGQDEIEDWIEEVFTAVLFHGRT